MDGADDVAPSDEGQVTWDDLAVNLVRAAPEVARARGELATARVLHRRSQFLLDYIEAENSMGFHASQEAARILAQSIDAARQGQLAVRDPAFKPNPRLPRPGHGRLWTGRR